MRHVADRHALLHRQRLDGRAAVLEDVAGAAADADPRDQREDHVLRADARREPAVDPRPRTSSGRRWSRHWVARTISTSLVPIPNASAPNAPCVDGVRVAAHDRHARLGQPELRPDDVDDALVRVAEAVERDAELAAVRRRAGGPARRPSRRGSAGCAAWSGSSGRRSRRSAPGGGRVRPRRRSPVNACGLVTSWTRCRSTARTPARRGPRRRRGRPRSSRRGCAGRSWRRSSAGEATTRPARGRPPAPWAPRSRARARLPSSTVLLGRCSDAPKAGERIATVLEQESAAPCCPNPVHLEPPNPRRTTLRARSRSPRATTAGSRRSRRSARPRAGLAADRVPRRDRGAPVRRLLLQDLPGPAHPVVAWPLLAAAFAARRAQGRRGPLPARDPLLLAERVPGRHRLLLAVARPSTWSRCSSAAAAALLVQPRQRLIKIAFNLANFLCVAAVSLLIVHTLRRPDGHAGPGRSGSPRSRRRSMAALISSVSIALVITLSGGAPQFEKLPEMLRFGVMVAFANTSLALLAVVIMSATRCSCRCSRSRSASCSSPIARTCRSARSTSGSSSCTSRRGSSSTRRSSTRRSSRSSTTPGRCSGQRSPRSCSTRASTAPTRSARRRSRTREPEVMVPLEAESAGRLHSLVVAASGRVLLSSRDRDPRIRQGMVGPLRGESGLIGSLLDREPPDRGNHVPRGRPAPARDARQPGRGRARERPPGAVAVRAVAAQGAAPVSRPTTTR